MPKLGLFNKSVVILGLLIPRCRIVLHNGIIWQKVSPTTPGKGICARILRESPSPPIEKFHVRLVNQPCRKASAYGTVSLPAQMRWGCQLVGSFRGNSHAGSAAKGSGLNRKSKPGFLMAYPEVFLSSRTRRLIPVARAGRRLGSCKCVIPKSKAPRMDFNAECFLEARCLNRH